MLNSGVMTMSKGTKLKSCTKYFCTALVALVAVLIGILLNLSTKPDDIVIHLSSQHPKTFSPAHISLTDEQITNYHRDGVVLVRGLLTPKEATAVADAAQEMIPKAPFTLFDIFATSNYAKIMFDLWRTDETIARLALQSLPSIASQLIQSDKIRLLRDAYFSYAKGGKGCGWHVDDEGFWPAQNDTSGITIWIALDEMRVTEGGGLAVANGTHLRNEWVQKCIDAIQSNTCNMATKSPECWERMEQVKLQWDMYPGDAIIWDRWSFHRTVVATAKDNDADFEKQQQRRYSVRYMPSNAKALGAVHHTVAQGSYFESPYYPQVWPNLIDSEVKALEHGLDGDATPSNLLKAVGGILASKIRGVFK